MTKKKLKIKEECNILFFFLEGSEQLKNGRVVLNWGIDCLLLVKKKRGCWFY